MPSGIGHFRRGRIALVLCSLYSFIRSPFLGVLLEDSPSGLWRTPGTRVGFTPSGVQIPHPPLFPRLRVFEVGDFCFWCVNRVLLWRCAVCCGRGFSAWGSGILECRYDFQEGWFFAPVS